jgi:hypothetical protein
MSTKPKLSQAVQAEVELYSRMPPPEPLEEDGPYGSGDDVGVPDYNAVLPPHIQKAVRNAWGAAQAIFMRAGIFVAESPAEQRIFQTLAHYVHRSLKDMERKPLEYIVEDRAVHKEYSLPYNDPNQFLKLLTEIEVPPE